jgi:hypothetical protein
MSDLASHAVCQRFGANKEFNRGHKNPLKRGARIEDREQRRRLLLGAAHIAPMDDLLDPEPGRTSISNPSPLPAAWRA